MSTYIKTGFWETLKTTAPKNWLNLTKLINDIVDSNYKPSILGSLKITDSAPTAQCLYILSDAGTYTNLGGLVATADKLNYAYFNGTTWSLIAADVLMQENFAETQNLITKNSVIYNYDADGVLTSAANPSVGINPKKDGSYEQAWEIFSVKNL